MNYSSPNKAEQESWYKNASKEKIQFAESIILHLLEARKNSGYREPLHLNFENIVEASLWLTDKHFKRKEILSKDDGKTWYDFNPID